MANGNSVAGDPQSVEVFAVAESFVDTGTGPFHGTVFVDVYEIDGIDHFEKDLSQGLPVSPETAKQIAIQRIGQVDEMQMQRIQYSALGLSKAMQYGIDRYPAIVFDRSAVVYGVTDLSKALDCYSTWQSDTPL